MTGNEAVFKNFVKRMLHACQTLCRIVVLVVDMKIIMADSLACFLRKKIVVNKRLCSLACEFHHHTGRRVGVHVCILTRDVVVFRLDNLMEHIAGLGLAGNAALVAVGNVAFGHFLAGAVHEFKLHHVLNLFDRHPLIAVRAYTVGYFLDKGLVFTKLCGEHGLADGRLDFFFVITDDSAVAFYNCLYH